MDSATAATWIVVVEDRDFSHDEWWRILFWFGEKPLDKVLAVWHAGLSDTNDILNFLCICRDVAHNFPERKWPMLDVLLAHPKWQRNPWVAQGRWIRDFGADFTRTVAEMPNVEIPCRIVEWFDALHYASLDWYLPLAIQHARLPVPMWFRPELPNPRHPYPVAPFCIGEVRLFWRLGAPADIWEFNRSPELVLREATKYDSLLGVLRKQVPDRLQLLLPGLAAQLFALMICVSDGIFRPTSRFFAIAAALPMELQSTLAGHVFGTKCPLTLKREELSWALRA